MSTKQSAPHRKLLLEILGLFFLSFIIAVFSFGFLYFTSCAIINARLIAQEISLTEFHITILNVWVRNLCLIASMIIFSAFFKRIVASGVSSFIRLLSSPSTVTMIHGGISS